MNTAEDFRLEREADRIIRESRAHQGEYPAYSESDLRRKSKQRGEIRECDLIPSLRLARPDGEAPSLLDMGVPLYDPERRSGVKPGYDILLLLIAYGCDLTPRQRRVLALTMVGLRPQEIAEKIRVSLSTCSRELDAAISVVRWRREELEKDYDLDRTAKVLHLQRIYLPPPGKGFRSLPLKANSRYLEEVERTMLGAMKPLLVPAERRCRYDRLSLKRLARELPQSHCQRDASSADKWREVSALAS